MATNTITACSKDAWLNTASSRNRNPLSNSEMSVEPTKLWVLVPVRNDPIITNITPMLIAKAVPAPISAAQDGPAVADGSAGAAIWALAGTAGGNTADVGDATSQFPGVDVSGDGGGDGAGVGGRIPGRGGCTHWPPLVARPLPPSHVAGSSPGPRAGMLQPPATSCSSPSCSAITP